MPPKNESCDAVRTIAPPVSCSSMRRAASCATAVHDAVGVWVTELPITPERVLRALAAKAAGESEPTRKGKVVVFDEDLSLAAVAHADAPVRLVVDA